MRPARSINSRHDDLDRRFYLYPGGLWAEREPGVVTTVLGSCVSVCLWDASAGVGGINHFVLPSGGSVRSGHYGNHAMPMLLEQLLAIGARQDSLLGAVFGGASVLSVEANKSVLGARNVEVAERFLHATGIPLVRQDTGGQAGRKLTFRSADGTTLVRKL
jgi:chemotaxis protein CheD